MNDVTKEQPLVRLEDGSPLTWLQLESLIPLKKWAKGKAPTSSDAPTVESLTTLSPETIERVYGEYVVRPSDHRVAMKLRHALQIAAGELKPSTT